MTSPAARLTVALSGHYRVERELGAGGMATVYLAHDLKHGREVAIKVLRNEVAGSLGPERFLREIHLAAKLSHPHILPLYDSGNTGGVLYFVMPNIEGASLRDRLDRVKQLPVDEAVRIASEVAGALDYAHRHGVVHRDIKPENIMLHDGHALVADFGIGKALSAGEGQSLTRTGMSVGTPAYMSPEQAVGEAVDGRTDLYALGCVLYEMLVGEPPFTGPTVQAVIAKRFVQTPADVTALRENVPRSVARAVHKALARTPIDRYESGAQFIAALNEVTVADHAPPAPEKSIAVLPFASLSQDSDDGFFADGITEEILNALATIPDLRVAGRGSVFSFKGKSEDPRTVGTKLNVATILEGTLRRSGNRVRITAQLLSAVDGYQLWSERYDRVLEDVFAVQDEIATAIAGRLRVALGGGRPGGPAKPPTQQLAAYELYLKGRALLYQRGRSIPLGIECFRQAVALDPGYAQAWAGLADGYTTSGFSGFGPAAEVMPKALEAAARALELGPGLAESHTAFACATMLYQRDYEGAERAFQRAIELNPNYPQARAWYGLFLLHWVAGRTDEAAAQLHAVLEFDPLSAYAHIILAFHHFTAGRPAEAIAHGRRGLELDPNSYLGHWALLSALDRGGQYEEAAAVAERALGMSGRHIWTLASAAAIYARWGKATDVTALFREAEVRAGREYMQASMLCAAAVAVGDADQAIACARRPQGVGTRVSRRYAAWRDGPRAPVREDLLNDRGRRDNGDDPHGATTLGADQRVDLDDLPQELRPPASGLSGCQRPCGHDRHRRTHVAGLGLTPHAARAGDVPAVVGSWLLQADQAAAIRWLQRGRCLLARPRAVSRQQDNWKTHDGRSYDHGRRDRLLQRRNRRVRGRPGLGDLLPGDLRVGPRDAAGMKEVGE